MEAIVNTPLLEFEEWRAVPGFEGRYEASSFGRVRSLRNAGHGYDRPRAKPRVLKDYTNSRGYRVVTLGRSENPTGVHRVVCLTFHGQPPSPDHTAAHRDGYKPNCRADNLRWATWDEQAGDRRRHGTIARGERQGLSKLTRGQVDAIRAQSPSKPQSQLAAEFGVGQPHISSIIRGAVWS
ncbi:HNH endonuclease [Novosphingobium sp. PhB165]|uniref:NUMOD4 domain-containing protein n=1 Tax=Novosphingobium sp. PhB165 TaxID=2485105 RepID=UPI00104CCDD9|nr:NUMOD4 domain-containing protein [Novosphingobium sp. PhB165]TCM21516.1 HNH endonuclease [Novosphingobium sp. PhB165]